MIKGESAAPRARVITADDGNEFIYTEMASRLKHYGVPIDSLRLSICNAKWAMTLAQLVEVQKSGAFSIFSPTHTDSRTFI